MITETMFSVGTMDELRTCSLAGLEHIEQGPDPVWLYTLRVGSGTTGNAPLLTLIHLLAGLPKDSPYPGVQNGVRSVILWGSVGGRLPRLLKLFDDSYGDETEVLTLDGKDVDASLDALFEEYQPVLFGGILSFIKKALEYLPQSGQRLIRIETTGEILSPDTLRFLKEKTPNAAIIPIYGTAQSGYLALACPHLTWNQYHPLPSITVEIKNPDSDGIGELMVTKPLNPAVQFAHFPLGDAGRFLPPCACGRNDAFEILGRIDFDFIRIVGTTLFRIEFDRIADELREYVADYEVLVQETYTNGKSEGNIFLNIIPTEAFVESSRPIDELGKEFSERVYITSKHTLADMIARGIFAPLSTSVVASFLEKAKKIRLRKI